MHAYYPLFSIQSQVSWSVSPEFAWKKGALAVNLIAQPFLSSHPIWSDSPMRAPCVLELVRYLECFSDACFSAPLLPSQSQLHWSVSLDVACSSRV
jgi:hypothetical protein